MELRPFYASCHHLRRPLWYHHSTAYLQDVPYENVVLHSLRSWRNMYVSLPHSPTNFLSHNTTLQIPSFTLPLPPLINQTRLHLCL
jgi:hypothetical protein